MNWKIRHDPESQVQQLQDEIAALEDANETLEDQVKNLKNENDTRQASIDRLCRQADEGSKLLKQYQQECQDLRKQLGGKCAELLHLARTGKESKFTDLQKKYDSLASRYSDLSKQYDRINKDRNDWEQRYIDLHQKQVIVQKPSSHSRWVGELTEDRDLWRSKYDAMCIEAKRLAKLVTETERKYADVVTQSPDRVVYAKAVQQLTAERDEWERRYIDQNLRTVVHHADSKAKLENTERKYKVVVEELCKVTRRNESLRDKERQLDNAERRYNDVMQELGKIGIQNESLRDKEGQIEKIKQVLVDGIKRQFIKDCEARQGK